MTFETLLAKSYSADLDNNSFAKLSVHLSAVKNAGQAIIKTVGTKILRQLDLDGEIWFSRLQGGLHTACLAHDIGKANHHFQEMVRGIRSPLHQAARHELLSALLLADEKSEIRQWALSLLQLSDENEDAEMLLNCVIGAVGGHHLKLDESGERAAIALRRGDKGGGCGDKIQMFLTHSDLKNLFGDFVTKEVSFDLQDERELDSLQMRFLRFSSASNKFEKKLRKNSEWWRFAAALKALTSAADVAGSALVSEEHKVSPARWVGANLAESQFVTTAKMLEVVAARLGGKELRPFQKAVAESKARVTLVEAGCGTGKTAAAYAWAANHADGRKLFFCYPTTGTATEGFRDYVAETDVEAELMHSRAAIDLENVTAVKGDEPTGESLVRVDSLKAWSPQVVVCTADTVLALPRNNRRGIYNSPAILTASFVFDELHAYDAQMLAAVVALINAMPNAHFLLMTASLPAAIREFLKTHIREIEQIETPRDLEELPRYLFERLETKEDALQIAQKAVADQKKVLWICNTVGRAQAILDALDILNLPAKIYHSRFKYEHRTARHRETINGFDREKSPNAIIAVTTQVAEMSLDLDADVLISEIAPISALIQRLGRLNRRITIEKPGIPRTAYFYKAEGDLPYKQNEIEIGEHWLNELIAWSRPLNQSDLSEHFKNLVAVGEFETRLQTRWLDSGFFAIAEEIREGLNSASIILPEDETACRKSMREIVRKTIPMNYDGKRMENWREYKGNLIAPKDVIDYNEKRGARWLQK